MIIKNLTSKVQRVEIREFTDDRRVYDIFMNPKSSTDLDGVYVLNPERYNDILDIEGYTPCSVHEEIKIETPVYVESSDEEISEEVHETAESFICDICHAEFASARGLSSHKNRAHPVE